MPLAQPISSLRKELNILLANDDLPAGLKLCKELLPEGGEKHKLILAMQAQLTQLNKDRMKGVISQEEYARRLAIIVLSLNSKPQTLIFPPLLPRHPLAIVPKRAAYFTACRTACPCRKPAFAPSA